MNQLSTGAGAGAGAEPEPIPYHTRRKGGLKVIAKILQVDFITKYF
jgi:hypothetical protein